MNPIGESLQIALRGALKMHARARETAEQHDGRSIALEMPNQRLVIRFEAGNVYVSEELGAVWDDTIDAGADQESTDATVRGSMPAVFAHLSGLREEAAVLGDAELVDDFRESFKPQFDPREFMAFAQDALHTGLAAMESAFEAFRPRRQDKPEDARGDAEQSDLAAEVAQLAEEVRRLNERIDELQNK